MKYKIGDKVKINRVDWNYSNKYSLYFRSLTEEMSKYCNKVATITQVCESIAGYDIYSIDLDKGENPWFEYMFDRVYENMDIKKIILPEGFEIDKVENGEIILKEIKKELPKTYEECFKQLGEGEILESAFSISRAINMEKCNDIKRFSDVVPTGYAKPLLAFCQLLVCREVYRQGWKPDWNNFKIDKYYIEYVENRIITGVRVAQACVLSFQSAKVRDMFLENFRDLIEEAKELI